jgi:AraC-like DNA-binding protein
LLSIQPMKLKDRVVPALEFADLAWCAGLSAQLWPTPEGAPDPFFANRALAALLPGARALDAQVVAAARRVMATGGEVRIAELARASALSARQFRRRFTAAVGISPKELARIWRFRRCALAALDPASPESSRWAELAADHGYADQAHLVREFRHLLGLPPSAFARQFSRIEHRNLRAT